MAQDRSPQQWNGLVWDHQQVDESHPLPVTTVGPSLFEQSLRTDSILVEILEQAKLTNMYLAILVDEEFTASDIREDL